MLRASVSNLELFRIWRKSDDLDMDWLLRRIRGEEPQTENMKAGEAFHKGMETFPERERDTMVVGEYRFDFNCTAEIRFPLVREIPIKSTYGDITVSGRIDGLIGREIIDYKTVAQFDPDRLMEGFQWRFYLDMLECETFTWEVFVIRPFGPEQCYEVVQHHRLRQNSYPSLHTDCEQLARDYLCTLESHLPEKASLEIVRGAQ